MTILRDVTEMRDLAREPRPAFDWRPLFAPPVGFDLRPLDLPDTSLPASLDAMSAQTMGDA